MDIYVICGVGFARDNTRFNNSQTLVATGSHPHHEIFRRMRVELAQRHMAFHLCTLTDTMKMLLLLSHRLSAGNMRSLLRCDDDIAYFLYIISMRTMCRSRGKSTIISYSYDPLVEPGRKFIFCATVRSILILQQAGS